MIESHGQKFKSYSCPTCGSKCTDPIGAQWCEAKHKIRDLMCVPYIVKAKAQKDYLKYIEVAKPKPKKAKPPRGINYDEKANLRYRRYREK